MLSELLSLFNINSLFFILIFLLTLSSLLNYLSFLSFSQFEYLLLLLQVDSIHFDDWEVQFFDWASRLNDLYLSFCLLFIRFLFFFSFALTRVYECTFLVPRSRFGISGTITSLFILVKWSYLNLNLVILKIIKLRISTALRGSTNY